MEEEGNRRVLPDGGGDDANEVIAGLNQALHVLIEIGGVDRGEGGGPDG